MREALRTRGRYDWETHQDTRRRNAEQIRSIPDPEFPATGTARISALLAEARRKRDAATLAALTDGRNGWRARTPADNLIDTTKDSDPRTNVTQEPPRDRELAPARHSPTAGET